jgi:hypothetical protein
MNKVQKSSNINCNVPSSEPFRIDSFPTMLSCDFNCPTVLIGAYAEQCNNSEVPPSAQRNSDTDHGVSHTHSKRVISNELPH